MVAPDIEAVAFKFGFLTGGKLIKSLGDVYESSPGVDDTTRPFSSTTA